MIDTIVFDLDGTLLDTLYDLYLCTNDILRQFDCKERTFEEIRQFVGNGIKKLIERALPETKKDLLEEAYQQFISHYDIHKSDHTKPYKEIDLLLEELNKRNFKMAIVSNKVDHAVKELCTPLFGKYIHVMLGETEKILKKPAPDMVYEALKQLNSKVENTLFVGDSETDVLTANNAHIKVCGVEWGFRGKEILQQLKIDYLIQTPLQLLDILSKEENK